MKTHLQYLQQSDWSIRWGKLLVMGTLLLWGSVLKGECCNETHTSIPQLILLLFYLHMSFCPSHLRITRGTAHWIYVVCSGIPCLECCWHCVCWTPESVVYIYWMWNDKFSYSLVCVLCHRRLVHVSVLKFVIMTSIKMVTLCIC